MEVLESAMAFAVVMILLSTIVTGIVELLLRIAGQREKILRTTVESLFETVVWPRLEARLAAGAAAGGDAKDKALADFLKGMTANPAFAVPTVDEPPGEQGGDKDTSKETERPWWHFAWLPSLTHRDSVDALTPLAFAERLARTEVGKSIVAEGKQELEVLVQDFVRSFDRYGRAASEVFRKNAKLVAILVGIVLTFAVNIDVGRLFTMLMNNPEVRTSLIKEAKEAAAANEKAAKRLQELSEKIVEKGLEEDQFEAIMAKISEIRGGIGALRSKGVPFGHSFYPYCSDGPTGDPLCAESAGFWSWLKWFLLTMVAGILIGLGGPFWFRVFSSLSQIFQVLRSLGVGSKPKQAKPEELDALPSAEESAKPKDVLDAFKVAAHVHGKGTAPAKRALLGPDGQPL